MATTEDAATALQITPDAVRKYCLHGRIKAKKNRRGDWVITDREIRKYAETRRVYERSEDS